jgi:hypothetical protein
MRVLSLLFKCQLFAMTHILNPINQINPINHGSDKSNDIIKAHGGEIIVETKEGEGAEFVIQLSAI